LLAESLEKIQGESALILGALCVDDTIEEFASAS
jgi:hypothetical protein